ncbi:MAG: hypothetical protein GY738_18350 [Pseudoalteromonas sp.]|nr:hypothetical protein [Pseudoalteromonas sp.]
MGLVVVVEHDADAAEQLLPNVGHGLLVLEDDGDPETLEVARLPSSTVAVH